MALLEGPNLLAPQPGAPPLKIEAPAPTPGPRDRKTNWLGWGVLAAGVAAGGTGAYFHVGALNTSDDADGLDPDQAGIDRHAALEDDFQGQQIGAGVSYAVGAVLVAVGITLLTMGDDP